jgi:hypothetical protein
LLVGINSAEVGAIWQWENNDIVLGTNGETRLRIAGGGDAEFVNNVGIGTAPSYPLHVAYNGSGPGIAVISSGSSSSLSLGDTVNTTTIRSGGVSVFAGGVDGDYITTLTNTSDTGHGLLVKGGTSASNTALLQVTDKADADVLIVRSGGTAAFSGTVTGVAPTADLHLATKKYVDDAIVTEDTLAEMNDVTLTSPADASLLIYDTGTSRWRDAAMYGDATINDVGALTLATVPVAKGGTGSTTAPMIGAVTAANAAAARTVLGAAALNGISTEDFAAKDLTLAGDLTVSGDVVTVNTATLSVEDPLIILASGNNAADTVDIGLYGLYDTSGSQDLYSGLFRDATDGKWRLFKDSQTEPTTTVDTSATGYAVATLVAELDGNAATATNVAYTGLTGSVPTWNQSTTGNAATATNVAYTGLTGTVPTWNQDTTGNAATSTEATNVTAVANNSADETVYPTFVDGATGTQGIETDTGLTYNPSTGTLTSTVFVGALTGNASTATTATTVTDNAITLAKMAGLARGSIIYGDADGNPAALTKGTDTQVLTSDGTDISWQDSSGGGSGTITALNNQAENRLVTIGSTTTELDGEANLVFDGTKLGIGGPPSNLLTLKGAGGGTGISLESTHATSNKMAIYWNDVGGVEKWRISNDPNSNDANELVILADAGTVDVLTAYQGGNVKFGGNVGIAGYPTSRTFEVHGTAEVKNTGGGANFYIQGGTADADASLWFVENGTTKSGVYHDASADALVLQDGATTDTVWVNGGNVGIGTPSPAANLEIEDGGTSNAVLLKVTADDGGPYGLVIGNDTFSTNDGHGFAVWVEDAGKSSLLSTGGDMHLYTGSYTNQLVLDHSTGDVGIGTAAPSTSLHVSGAYSSGVTPYIRSEDTTSTGAIIDIYASQASAAGYISTGTSTDLRFAPAGSTKMLLEHTTGNLGIGTPDPLESLHIHNPDDDKSYVQFSNTTTETRDSSGTGNHGLLVGINSAEVGAIWQWENNDIVLGTNGETRLRIAGGGDAEFKNKVGIGTMPDTRHLQIHEATSGESTVCFTNLTTGTGVNSGLIVGLDASENGQIWAANAIRFGTDGSASEALRIPASGHMHGPAAGAEICIACSDETTALETGDNKVTFLIPRAMTVTEVKASLTQVDSMADLEVDVRYHATPGSTGATIFGSDLTIAAGEYYETKTGAVFAGGASSKALAADSFIYIDINDSSAAADFDCKGLKVWLLGYWT